jgi:hypothetical protein
MESSIMMKYLAVAAGAGILNGLAACSGAAPRGASLTQEPLVMRLSKDEFRIVFGLAAQQCAAGSIRYRVDWRTDAGTLSSEVKRVNFDMPRPYTRAMTVDRQYFDTAEGAHTTEIVKVSVDEISCTAARETASAALPTAP